MGLAAVFGWPLLLSDNYWLHLSVFIGIYFVLSMGLTLLFGYANQLSLGHAGFFGLGAYVSALCVMRADLPAWLGMLLGTMAAWAIGFAIGRPILRLHGLSLAMATLALGQIMYILFTELPITNGSIGLAGIPHPAFGSVALDSDGKHYWLVALAALAAAAFSHNVARSHVGRALRALDSNENAAQVVGIDVPSYKTMIIAYSAALAGLSGSLYAHYVTYISSDSFRPELSILILTIIAVGGRKSFWGALLGAAFLTIVPQYLIPGPDN